MPSVSKLVYVNETKCKQRLQQRLLYSESYMIRIVIKVCFQVREGVCLKLIYHLLINSDIIIKNLIRIHRSIVL